MQYETKLEHFEGPLDLLLQLIERSELEITEITLSQVTTQYLSYINTLVAPRAAELQQFLDLAARLIYLKSVALLPTLATPEQDEGLADLAEQLEQYRQYSKAAGFLQSMIQAGRSWERPVRATLSPSKAPLPKLELAAIAAVFQQELQRLPILPEARLAKQIDLPEACRRVRTAVSRGSVDFAKLVSGARDRTEALVLFLAVLEMIKSGEIRATQLNHHQPITIHYETTRAVPVN